MLREHGKQTVCTKFSFTNRLKTIEALYQEVVQM
jgi:hypothetical protein